MFVIVKSDPASGVGTTLVRNLEFVPGFFEGWKKYFLDYQFLANDVTLVTSYGYCQSLKINDRRLDRRCTYVRCLSYDL